MKIQVTILVILLSVHLASIGQNSHFKPEYSTIINSDKREYMCRPPSRPGPRNITGYWDMFSSDIEKLENNFRNILKLRSQEISVGNLEAFAYQYAGFIIEGKKYIYINAFYNKSGSNPEYRHNNWKNDPVLVRDGGPYYWGVIFSIDDVEFTQLAFNGSA